MRAVWSGLAKRRGVFTSTVGQATDGTYRPDQDSVLMRDGLKCSVCGDALGVYEPVVVSAGGSMRTTSLAAEPELYFGSRTVIHRDCARAPAAPGCTPITES